MRQVRHRQQHTLSLALERFEIGIELLDALRPLAIGVEQRRGVLAEPLQAGNLLTRRVLRALQRLDLENERPAPVVERREVGQQRLRLQPPVLQAGADQVGMIADKRGIQHAAILYLTARDRVRRRRRTSASDSLLPALARKETWS